MLILWSIVAVMLTILISLPFKVVEWCFIRMRWKMGIEHILIFTGIFMLLSVLTWKGRFLIWHFTVVTMHIKLIVLLVIVIVSVLLSILSRHRAVSWINTVQERITPLVWLFGVVTVLSIPLLAYHIAVYQTGEGKDKKISPGYLQTSVEKKHRNIILVTFDALTARDMSVYGYDRETTPFINEWAGNASIFTMAEAESNYTTPTTASLMTGKRVWTHQLYQPHGYNIYKADTENLPLMLQNHGYYNIALIQNSFASVETLGISNSFDIAYPVADLTEPSSIEGFILKQLFLLFGNKYHLYNWFVRNDFVVGQLLRIFPQNVFITEYPPEKVFEEFLKVMDNNPPEPFFAWIHLLPPHDPYLPPGPFMGMFDSSQELRTIKQQNEKNKRSHIDTARARYDEFIRYCDKEFENFTREFEKYDKNALIILSSDHGHSFEHDYLGHGGPHLYEQLTSIPLIIKEPDQRGRRVINNVVEQVDIAPTILDLAKIQVPEWMEGHSLVPLMEGKDLPSKPALSMYLESTPSGGNIIEGTIAVWDEDYKLIHYLKDNKSLLFSLKHDQGELENIFGEETETGRRLLDIIYQNLEEANKRINER